MCTETKKTREPQYTALVNIRNTELAAYWTRYNIQAVLNLGLLVAALSAKSGSMIAQHIIPVAFLGSCLSAIWLCLTIWGKRLITDRWEEYIRKYELNYSRELFQLFLLVKEENQKGLWNCLKIQLESLNILTRVVPIILIVVWITIAISVNSQLKLEDDTNLKSEIHVLSIKFDKLNSDLNRIKADIDDIKDRSNNHNPDNKIDIILKSK